MNHVSIARAGRPAFVVLGAITFCHLLNDVMQALLPAIYPMLKSEFALSFGQIGLVSRDGAAMLLSSGWRPHGESNVGWRSPLEPRRAAMT